MVLDPKSMSVVAALAYVVLALWLGLVQATQKTYPGFRAWLAGAALQSGSFLLMAGAGVLPGIPELPNAMIVASADCLHRGLRRFAGREARPTATEVTVYALAGAILFHASAAGLPPSVRITVVSVLVVWLLGRAAWFAARALSGGDPVGARIIAVFLAATAAVIAARAIHAVLDPVPYQRQLLGRGSLDMTLIAAITMLSMCSIGAFLLLNLRRAVAERDGARTQVLQLEAIITICMHCGKLRDDGQTWVRLEQYMAKYSDTRFSHGLCPDCLEKHFPAG